MSRARRWTLFGVLAALHAASTYVLVLLVMGWSMVILDGGGREAPLGLQIASVGAFVLSLPLLLPLAYAALALGFADPVNDPIYFPLPLLNSIAVAAFGVFGVPRLVRRWRKGR
jgi:hypothetical protein